jgi:hypothetical protein
MSGAPDEDPDEPSGIVIFVAGRFWAVFCEAGVVEDGGMLTATAGASSNFPAIEGGGSAAGCGCGCATEGDRGWATDGWAAGVCCATSVDVAAAAASGFVSVAATATGSV